MFKIIHRNLMWRKYESFSILFRNVWASLPQSVGVKGRKHFHRQRENDRRIFLSRYWIQSLNINTCVNIWRLTGSRTWRYLSWRAAGDIAMMSAASLRALLLFCSPSAAITLALASLVASASAAMALCSCWGSLTSLISTRSTWTPQGLVASSYERGKQNKWLQKADVLCTKCISDQTKK